MKHIGILMVTVMAFAQASFAGDMAKLSPEDAKIAEVMLMVNSIELKGGIMAKEKTVNPEVKTFAKEMVIDHTNSKHEMQKLLFKNKTKPEKSELSKAFHEQNKADIKKLNRLTSSEFDREYVNTQLTAHQKVLDTIDSELLPKVSNADLKALLEKSRTTVAQHLEHTKMLRDTLAKQ